MRFFKLVPFIFLLNVACFQTQDLKVDKALNRAIQDQRVMVAQDENAERQKLQAAREAGLKLIEEKRQVTGKSLENLKGPDGNMLLNWQNAMMLNAAFDQLKSDFEQAVAGLDALITVKYQKRMVPIQITESYLDYIQTRRHAGEYAVAGFLEGITGIQSSGEVEASVSKLKALGLPTSLDELSDWLKERAGTVLSGALAKSPGLSGVASGVMSLFQK